MSVQPGSNVTVSATTMKDVVEQRLSRVETKDPLIFAEIDFSVRDPEGLAAALAAPLAYAQRVEAVVAALGITTLMPRYDGRVERFLAVWTVDEVGHGEALGELMRQLGLEPFVDDNPTTPVHNHAIGLAGRLSSKIHDVVAAVWGTAGAMNEHFAMAAYTRMDAILQKRGEHALHETLFRRLRAHESSHKAFYAAYAGDMMARMQPWQVKLTRLIVEHTWRPVGAGARRDRPAFAHTVNMLAGNDWEAVISTPVQQVAERLLNDGQVMNPFVRKAVLRCLAAA